MKFAERNSLASEKNIRLLKAESPSSLRRSSSPLYTPHMDKFDGYGQFPRPRVEKQETRDFMSR